MPDGLARTSDGEVERGDFSRSSMDILTRTSGAVGAGTDPDPGGRAQGEPCSAPMTTAATPGRAPAAACTAGRSPRRVLVHLHERLEQLRGGEADEGRGGQGLELRRARRVKTGQPEGGRCVRVRILVSCRPTQRHAQRETRGAATSEATRAWGSFRAKSTRSANMSVRVEAGRAAHASAAAALSAQRCSSHAPFHSSGCEETLLTPPSALRCPRA